MDIQSIIQHYISQRIPTPSEHYAAIGVRTAAKKAEQPGFWQQRTISDILGKAEQTALENRASELRSFIGETKEQRLNAESFLGMVRKYSDITELTAEIIRSFVEKIEVQQPEKVPGTRTKKQTIIIWWNFIGAVDIPDESLGRQKKTA